MQRLQGLPDTAALADDQYHVYALCYAHNGNRRVHDAFLMPQDLHDGPMPIDYSIWIVENRHRRFIVDLGFDPASAQRRNRKLAHHPVEALERIGVQCDEVSDIVITHLHCDHAGNMERFSNATIHVQDAEVAFVASRCMCEDHLRFPYELDHVLNVMRKNFAKQLAFHDGDGPLFPGVTLHKLAGHTAGLQGVRVNTPRGPVLLASDATHYFPNAFNLKPHPITLDVASMIASYRTIMSLVPGPEFVIPGHDPKVRDIYPKLVVSGIVLHALHEAPRVTEAGYFKSVANYLPEYPLDT
ncbi:N-acyl homoserine lactonase family protein [Rhizobium sp. CF142]|uniref:N-acyl homoserine lactonase family protein n=1 Tax=Rhizobium sp. CF142 TaxID=1144314 RepID=UPI00026EF443|nr:N-acyl homoserine lactonase family protein [Rhizobium sp. CF142]EJJ29489.1 Zn-dependent hydrolase, glyoxylase [Rhizobium sp. CF142]